MSTNGFVHIVESPSSNDLLDGRTEGRALGEALRLAQIPHTYNLAVDRSALRSALGERLSSAWTNHSKLPILHLSMHGNKDGVQLTNGDFLSWHDLRVEIAPLMKAMNGGLLICLSSCSGGAGGRMAMYEDDQEPFWALVGNTANTAWADAAVGYITFYHLFFKGQDVFTCVNAMQVASADSNFVVINGRHTRDSWKTFMQKQRMDQLGAALRALRLNSPIAGSLAQRDDGNGGV